MKINRFVIMSAYKSNKSAIENTLATAKLLTVYGDAALVQGRFEGCIEYSIHVPVDSVILAREYAAHMKAYFDQVCILYVEHELDSQVLLGGTIQPNLPITLRRMGLSLDTPDGEYTLLPNEAYLHYIGEE